MTEPRDAPYPELKKSHTMARTGRPWRDHKPPPAAPVWAAIQGLGSYHVARAAIELDVFDTLAESGPSSVGVLAARLDVSEPHLGSLLDSLVALDLIDQFRDVYELNDTARRYLTSDGAASMAGLIAVAPGPHENWATLADTIRTGRPATPIEDDPAAFYRPLAEGTFTTMWRCATRADLKVRYSSLVAPRILDLGAGGAPWSIAILEACPDGSAVVNDLPGVIDVALVYRDLREPVLPRRFLDILARRVGPQRHHLRSRRHDVADPETPHPQHIAQHPMLIVIDNALSAGELEERMQLLVVQFRRSL